MTARFRERLGCWLHERWRTELVLRLPRLAALLGWSWLDLCNRNERLRTDALAGGRECLWAYSSALTVARVFPDVGSRLLHHCLRRFPIRLESVASNPVDSPTPEISVVIGVRGTGRLEQFKSCLQSLLVQSSVIHEIVVVEQSWLPEFKSLLPAGVRYLHQQSTHPDMPYNRSWALNAGACAARGRVLVLHDADMLLPQNALAVIVAAIDHGLDAVRLPRLLFYLDADSSVAVQRTRCFPQHLRFERVIANNRTPIAVRRDCYFGIGGHDEAFYGWGAEDDEFMDRLRTCQLGEGAMLPIVHLWHTSAAGGDARNRNAALLEHARLSSPQERIEQLRARSWGGQVPSVAWTSVKDAKHVV